MTTFDAAIDRRAGAEGIGQVSVDAANRCQADATGVGQVPVDAAIRDRITAEGLDETLFVEAGAGTGKTTQLVERITNLVLDRGVRLRHIAAITFTEAAASELQDRIRVAFERRELATGDEGVRRRCREAIADADLAAITTLHGFAKRILAEHPLAAGLPPRFAILDEVSSELAREARWDRFVDALYDDPNQEELLVRALSTGAALEPRYVGHATMKDVAVELGQSWDRLGPVADAVRGPLEPIDFRPFDVAVAEAQALPGRCSDPSDKFYCHLVGKVLPALQAITSHVDPALKLQALSASGDWTGGRGGKASCWRNELPAAKETVAQVNQAKRLVLARVADDVLARLLTLVSREVRDAAEARRAEGQLEFHDLLVLCRRLLRTDGAVRRQLGERYAHLFLDEFQDTDPIQVELAVLIAASVEGNDTAEWDTATVKPGRLFFVGDPKQSIYRFRRADIELFLRARDRFGADGKWLRLAANFRTVPPVLGWINTLFGQLMSEEIPGRQPRYEPLVAHRGGSPEGDHRPILLGGPRPKARASELRECEAADVARTVQSIRAQPERWPVDDGDRHQWRPARLADVTVLVPTRTSLPYLRAALAQADIPYRLDTGTLVYDTQEVGDVLAALRAVDDPTDGLSLITALRSPVFACADTDLFTYRHAGGVWDLRQDRPGDLSANHPVVAALAHLRSLWEQRWWLGPSELLGRLLHERQAFLLALGDERPKEVWGRLRFLLDQARAFEEAGGGTLRTFLQWAALQSSGSARVHEPLLPETDDESVRIMTVHGAKGLEFPITILSGMTTKPGANRTGVSVLWDDEGNPEVKIRANLATANHDPRADIEAEMDAHEKLRLLYVACTRARDHLVVSCHHQDGDGSYANIVWRKAEPDQGSWRCLPPQVEPYHLGAAGPGSVVPPSRSEFESERQAWISAREELLGPQRRSRFISATAVAAEAGTAPVLEDGGTEDHLFAGLEDPIDAAVARRRRGRAGTAIGRAVHATLQLLDFGALGAPAGSGAAVGPGAEGGLGVGDLGAGTGPAGWGGSVATLGDADSPPPLDVLAARQADLEAIPELSATVASMVRSALASEAVKLARGRPHHKEMYVSAAVGDRVIEGYVDLLIEGPQGLIIVDYKTDSVASAADVDAKLAAYELQAAAYAVALEEGTGLAVEACHFVFCRPGGAIERKVADLAAVMRQVRHLAG